MKKITRILSSVMAISMLSMPLAACSSSESASPASPAESQSSAASSGVIEISFPTFMCGTASQTEWCAQRVEAFNTEYEGKYKVIVEEIPGDQNYIDKLKVLYSADDLPDVIVTGGYNLIDMMKDKLVDLTPYLDEDTEWKGQLSSVGVHYVNLYSGTGMPVNVTSVVITPKDRTFISHRDDFGYNDTMKQQLFEQLRGASIIRMSNHLYEVYSRIKQENPDTIFVMDTGWDDTMSLDSYAKYLELADYYTPNKKEALKLTQTGNVEDAARILSRYFETTIIKLGPDGCLLRENGQNEIFPATSGIDPIDATGAGDAFNAGFIYGLYHNYDIRTCIAMGNRMGGACVSKVGCLSGYLTEEQLLREFQASNSSC